MQAQYNQANRLTQLTLYPNTPQTKTYVLDYDLEGNLIKKQNSTDTSCTQDCTEYVWDANNRLAQLKINGQTTAVYSYDAQGRRVEASISTSNNGTAQTNTVQYIYEGNQAVGEVRNGQLSHSLLTGLFIDEHLARTAIATNGQTQSQAQLTDALGSVIALANAQTSSINTSYNYSPYGQTQATGENSSNNQQYTGREAGIEGEAGLYYYRARYYDPVLKRFISEDPIRLSGGLNVYAYVEGKPAELVDPSGRIGAGVIIGALVIGTATAIITPFAVKDCMTRCGCEKMTTREEDALPCDDNKCTPLRFAKCADLCTIPISILGYLGDPLRSASVSTGEEIGKAIGKK